jgi:CheY-like chemotaxis protein
VRLIVTRFLEAAGYTVVPAGDGDEGLSLFREQADRLALVILDLTMPRMDGCEALREIRRIKGGARVIVSSGYAEEDVARRFVDNEMPDAFLQKPYTRGAFLEKVRDILARG